MWVAFIHLVEGKAILLQAQDTETLSEIPGCGPVLQILNSRQQQLWGSLACPIYFRHVSPTVSSANYLKLISFSPSLCTHTYTDIVSLSVLFL